jgi:hypothetical protein
MHKHLSPNTARAVRMYKQFNTSVMIVSNGQNVATGSMACIDSCLAKLYKYPLRPHVRLSRTFREIVGSTSSCER